VSPFHILHVCMGNICRSPMAERLLMHAVAERVGDRADELIVSESTGTGGWHEGESMNPPAARELRRRLVPDDGFRARKLAGSHLERADLILTATSEQLDYVEGLRPDALDRAFVLGEFGRLVAAIKDEELPPYAVAPNAMSPDAVYARGVAIVTVADQMRAGVRPRPADDLADPWGRDDAYFRSTADEIVTSIEPFVDLMFPAR
jgi:protein-tyrosine phosphatase